MSTIDVTESAMQSIIQEMKTHLEEFNKLRSRLVEICKNLPPSKDKEDLEWVLSQIGAKL